MPAYCYTTADESLTVMRFYRVSDDRPTTVTIGPDDTSDEGRHGEVAYRNLAAEHARTAHNPGNWPMVSNAASVHPDQVGEAVALDNERGVPTEYTRRGQPIFRDRGHRRDWCRAHGLRDNDGGFGDAT